MRIEKHDSMIYLSPMQGLTDFVFRNAMHTIIGGPDKYFAPYISLIQKGDMQKRQLRDIVPERQAEGICLVPQIMGRDAAELLAMARKLMEMGYSELNWNLGCPYPMVAKRGCGAGLIADIAGVTAALDALCAADGLSLSVKLRSGYLSQAEFIALKPVLARYPLREIIVHPRTGVQMYDGFADRDFFRNSCLGMPFPVVYNGDITDPEQGIALQNEFGTIALGRGGVTDPLLALSIKNNGRLATEDAALLFWKFHDAVLEGTIERMTGGDIQICRKMYEYWQYWQDLFPNSDKEQKRIKKSARLAAYQDAVRYIKHGYEIYSDAE